MALIPIGLAGQYGIIQPNDRPPHEIPLNAWSGGQNVRMRDGMVEKFLGHQQAFGTPGTAPRFAMPLRTGGVYYWIYMSLTKAFVWDGNVHTNITRQTASVDVDYTGTALKNWTGGLLGGIPILNNGADVPQMWNPVSLTQKLIALSNWDANHKAGALRVFRRFLVAMDITKTGVRHAQLVKWSHPAASGAVPTSWDAADATKDAGEYEILDSDGAVVDAARMRDFLVLYKDDSVHAMQFIGGVDVFRFPSLFDNFGILTRRCAIEFQKGKHFVLALGDIIVHDAQAWNSVINSRLRKWLFNQIDSSNYEASFVALAPAQHEVWACVPTLGNSIPNLAVVWNWDTGAVGLRDLAAAHIANGDVSLTTGDTWDVDPGTWDTDPSIWGEGFTNPAGRRTLLCDAAGTKLHLGDSTNQFAGVSMTSYIERLSLPVPVKPDGPPDMRTNKFIRDLYPQIYGTTGATVKVHLGTQKAVDGSVTWMPPRDYVIGTTRNVDVRVNTPLLAVRFESTGNFDWKLAGYEIDASPAGRF